MQVSRMQQPFTAGLFFCAMCSVVCGQQNDAPAEARRTKALSQFEKLDRDRDGALSEDELDELPRKTIGRLHDHGLPPNVTVSRDEYLAAAVAVLEMEEQRDREKEEERQQRKELKFEEASATATEPSGAPTANRKPSGKSRIVPRLPSEYLARDKNGDGQIGLYEWDRAKYAEFVKLDKNGDGFLTASELIVKSTVAVRSGDGSRGSRSDSDQGSTESDPVGKEARDTFARMDKNNDGGIAEDEWAVSQRVRPMFENAGVNVVLPMNLDSFVANYRQAKASAPPR